MSNLTKLTEDQITAMAESFEDNFTIREPDPEPVVRKKRAPKRPHGWWWPDISKARNQVIERAKQVCDQLEAHTDVDGGFFFHTASGEIEATGFRSEVWAEGGYMTSMVIHRILKADKIWENEDQSEEASLRRNDIVNWVREVSLTFNQMMKSKYRCAA
ncbi:hypothetical protein [Paenirhodobacter populi]|uniref:Uncharacterized protein n=1 Tax=Paenirhodobacter populi TaxID=2306993 RepID=A0A443J055_9RHOB|nr:hypothetical protein [Sinirhodobacter populi]RWR13807.1 hypothetical protein D2T33_05260 [Sinirhodobacter populi]